MRLSEINEPKKWPIVKGGVLPTSVLQNYFDSLKQDMTNATIDVEPYNSPSFRLDMLEKMIAKLTTLRDRLASDSVVTKAQTSGNIHGSAIERAKFKK